MNMYAGGRMLVESCKIRVVLEWGKGGGGDDRVVN